MLVDFSKNLTLPFLYRVVKKECMFLKWVVVRRVKVGDLPTLPENSAEGSVQ
jgi:hypothetical protein